MRRPVAGRSAGHARNTERSAGHAWTAVEEERRRWARELHDETLQNLAGLMLKLSSARRAEGAEVLREAIEDAIVQLQQEVVNLRSLITDLRPAALDELGLEVAISALAQRAAQNGLDVSVRFDLTDGNARRADLDTAIYRIVQEALNNAQRHGAAGHAAVEIEGREEFVDITVRDDGCGFDPAVRSGGFGMIGMRERAELFGGSVRVYSAPGRGATIRATLRVPAATVAVQAIRRVA